MNKIDERIEQVKKGCGEVTNPYYKYAGDKIVCGYKFPDDSIAYCKRCQAELQAFKFAKEEHDKFVEKLKFDIFSSEERKLGNTYYTKGWDDNATRINKTIDELNNQEKSE